MTLGDLAAQGVAALERAGVPGAALDARALLAHAAGIAPGRLSLALRDAAAEGVAGRFHDLIERRVAREPVAQIIGMRAFHDHVFRVTRDVLDPRPETETLVQLALARRFRRVLDLGTGSGAILLSLLAARAGAQGLGTDLSAAALDVAAQNAARLGLAERVTWCASDWFSDVAGRFDLIVSNPPYIAAQEMPGLAPELVHEPRMALTDEGDGLSAYRAITAGAGAFLEPGGWLMVEIGHRQGEAVSAMFRDAGLGKVTVAPDLDGRDRVVCGQAPQ